MLLTSVPVREWLPPVIVVIVIVVLTIGGLMINNWRAKRNKKKNGNKHYQDEVNESRASTNSTRQYFDNQKRIWFANLNKNVNITGNLYEKADVYPFFSNFHKTKEYLLTKTKSMTKGKECQNIVDDLGEQFFDIWSNAETTLMSNFKELGIDGNERTVLFEVDMYKQFLNHTYPSTIEFLYAHCMNNVIDYCNGKLNKGELLERNSKAKRQYDSFMKEAVNQMVQAVYQMINSGYTAFDQNDSGFGGFDNQRRQQTYNQYDDFDDEKTIDEITIAYETLEIDESASDEEVRRAYKKLAMKYHPDKNKSKDAAEMMTKVNAAYTLIKKTRGI